MHRYINERKLSDYIGVSVHKLRHDRYIGGGLPYIKFGRRVIYDVEDVDNYLHSRYAR